MTVCGQETLLRFAKVGLYLKKRQFCFFFCTRYVGQDGEEFQFYLPRYSTVGPHKRRICVFVRSIKKCMGEYYIVNLYRGMSKLKLKINVNLPQLLCIVVSMALKDGAYYCYCAYVLRISRYSDFLSPMLTNTGVFLRGLKLSGESRS